MSIIEHDFGKKKRQIVRRFTTLLSLDALHEANVEYHRLLNCRGILEDALAQVESREEI
jgi:hypothetical protein